MIIGISGTICAGKNEVANYLLLNGFTLLQLKPSVPSLRVPSVPGGVPGYSFDDTFDGLYTNDGADVNGHEVGGSGSGADNHEGLIDPLEIPVPKQNGLKTKDSQHEFNNELENDGNHEQNYDADDKEDNGESKDHFVQKSYPHRKKTLKELMNEYSDNEDQESKSQNESFSPEFPEVPLPKTGKQLDGNAKESTNGKRPTSLSSPKIPTTEKSSPKTLPKTSKRASSMKPSKSIVDLIQQMTTYETYGVGNDQWSNASNHHQQPYVSPFVNNAHTQFHGDTSFNFGNHVSFAQSPVAVSQNPHHQQQLLKPPYMEFVSKEGLRRLVFESLTELTKFVGTQWRSDFVMVLNSSDDEVFKILCELSKMPYFMHISVDASILKRWNRYLQKYHDYELDAFPRMNMDMLIAALDAKLGKEEPKKIEGNENAKNEGKSKSHRESLSEAALRANLQPPVSLEDFVKICDFQKYGPHSLDAMRTQGNVRGTDPRITIVNNENGLGPLYVKLGRLNLRDDERLRPSWDLYFMRLAGLAALRSNCMKRRVGCVVVRENRVIATGYNGTPRGLRNCNEGGCGRCNGGGAAGSNLDSCVCLHAEENALLEAGRDRVGASAVIYCSTAPCLTCSIKIVQCGIKEVIYEQKYSAGHNSEKLFIDAGIKVRQFVPPDEGVVM